MKQIAALLFALLLPLPALADMADARACADGLSPSAKIIYSESLKAMRSGKDPKDAVNQEVRRLVANGTLKREWARDVTAAAVQCMRKLRP